MLILCTCSSVSAVCSNVCNELINASFLMVYDYQLFIVAGLLYSGLMKVVMKVVTTQMAVNPKVRPTTHFALLIMKAASQFNIDYALYTFYRLVNIVL